MAYGLCKVQFADSGSPAWLPSPQRQALVVTEIDKWVETACWNYSFENSGYDSLNDNEKSNILYNSMPWRGLWISRGCGGVGHSAWRKA